LKVEVSVRYIEREFPQLTLNFVVQSMGAGFLGDWDEN